MWQVTCEVGNGQTGKLVSDSWVRAAWQYVAWRIKGRRVAMARYESDAPPMTRPTDFVDRGESE